jgi:hypothetical protein
MLKGAIMAGLESKLSQKEEARWRRGLKEIKRLQSEQQEVSAVVSGLQEKQEALLAENQQLRTALCDVTSKFELVVNEMRQALRQLPQSVGQVSPSPSVASTAASDAASTLGALVLHAPELAQGRLHVGHLERALQRYKQLPETFEDAWQRLSAIQEKARLVIEVNGLIENRLDLSHKANDAHDECRTLLVQYEDALRKLQKATLSVLEAQCTKRAAQDESFTEPTPPSSQGKTSLGLTPAWPTCTAEDASSSCETFCTPPRVSVSSEDQWLVGESCWPTWQNQYHPSPVFPGMRTAAPPAEYSQQPPQLTSPAVLSLASALTTAPTGYPSPTAATSPTSSTAVAGGGLKQLQLAECLEEPRTSSVSNAVLPAKAVTPVGTSSGQQRNSGSGWQESTLQYATPPYGLLKVELRKEPGHTTLGMEVNEVDGTALQVQSIDDSGLVGRYNMAQGSESTVVRIGDMILEVNGVSGNPHAMLQECKAQQQLLLTISRGKDASPTASSSPAAAPGAGSLGDAGHTCQGVSDAGELDRVLAEVSAPPMSWGRLRPEARVFVPSSVQASDSKVAPDDLESDTKVMQANGWAASGDVTADRPPVVVETTDATGSTRGVAACGEDGVARALFP